MADASKKDAKTLRDVMRVIFRRKMHFLVAASATALALLVGSHWMPLKYTGTTKFTLRSDSAAKTLRAKGNEDLDTIKLTLHHDLLDRRAVEKVIHDLGLDKGMPHNAQGELTKEGKQRQQALVGKLQRQTALEWEVRSQEVDLISLSVINEDPRLAQKIPNELVKNYIEKTSEQITRRLADSNSFLMSQVTACSLRLKELESQRIDFQTQYARMMPESPGFVQKRIDDLNAEMLRLTRDRQTAQDRLKETAAKIVYIHGRFPRAIEGLSLADANSLRTLVAEYRKLMPTTRPAEPIDGVAAGPTTTPADGATTAPADEAATKPAPQPIQVVKIKNPERTKIEDQIADLEQAIESSKTFKNMTENHPDIVKMRRMIKLLQAKLEGLPEKVVAQEIYDTGVGKTAPPVAAGSPNDPEGAVALFSAMREWTLATREHHRLEQDLAMAKAQRDDLVALMANYAAIHQRWEELNSKVAEREKELKIWQDRRNEVQISLAAEVAKKRTHLETVQAAQEQFLPSSPKMSYILGGAMFAALAVGAGWVLLLNLIDRTIPTTDKAMEFFDLPIHGVIGEIVSAKQRRNRRLRRLLLSPAIYGVALVCIAAAGLSVILRLQFPDQYPQWQSDPLTFLYDKGAEAVGRLMDAVRSF